MCHIRPVAMVYWPCGKLRIRADIGQSYNKRTCFQLQKVSIMSETYNFSFLRRLALQFLLCTKNLLHQTTWTTRSFTGNIMVKFQSSLLTLTNPGSYGKITINSNEPLLSFSKTKNVLQKLHQSWSYTISGNLLLEYWQESLSDR